ncbi:MAG TPA: hypothetical protein VFC46_13055, partial [Humisphaera sp.]|nr:hypothetical protein [Humisphaera sp.]
LGPLLSQHRILSLAKAPLIERIEILSALAERDSENTCWRQEIKLLEIARLEEIREAAIAAVKASDSGRISELLESLNDRSWHGPVPKDLRDELQRALDETSAVENTAAASKLAEELIAACEDGDLDRAMQLQTQWNDVARVIPPSARDQIRETLDPAIAWIDAGNQARNPQVDIEPAAAPSIIAGYESSFGTLEAWRRRFSPLVLKCVAAGVALAAVGAYLVMHFSARHR